MDTNRQNVRGAAKFTYFLIFIIVILFVVEFNDGGKTNVKNNVNEIPKATSFKIISSSENQDLDRYLKEYANQKDEVEYKKNMANISTEMVSNPLNDKDGNIITDPKEYKQQQLNNEIDTVLKYKSGKRKEAALKSIDALQDEMFTMTDLKFNIEKRKEQINILKGVK